jgi:hypothetical protein
VEAQVEVLLATVDEDTPVMDLEESEEGMTVPAKVSSNLTGRLKYIKQTPS